MKIISNKRYKEMQEATKKLKKKIEYGQGTLNIVNRNLENANNTINLVKDEKDELKKEIKTLKSANRQILEFELEEFNVSVYPQEIEEGQNDPTVDKITTKVVGNTLSIYGILKQKEGK